MTDETRISKKEYHVNIITGVHNQLWQEVTEIFDDLESALEEAKEHCLEPVRFSKQSDYQPSVEIVLREVFMDDDGNFTEEHFLERIDPFEKLGLSEADILAKADTAAREEREFWEQDNEIRRALFDDEQ